MCSNINQTQIQVRYSETDQMAVAYHGNYFAWFEIGRTELMREAGLPYGELEDNGLFLPVLKAYCEYKSSVLYDDVVTVITRTEKLSGTRIKFTYEIIRDHKVLAEGYTEHAFLQKGGKPVILYKHNSLLWERLSAVIGPDEKR